MKLELIVEFKDGTKKEVTAVFADFVGFEQTFNRSVTAFEREMRLTDLAWLAWSSEKRNQATPLPFQPDWVDKVAEISLNLDKDDDGDSPLETTAPIG